MKHRRNVVVTVYVVLLLAGAGYRALSAAAAPPDLTGTWVLNAKESEDPEQMAQRWIQARSVGGSAGGGAAPSTGAGDGGSGGYDVAGGGSGRGMGAVGTGLLQMMKRFSQNGERLTIQQGDPEVTITNAAGQSNLVYTDGRVVESANEEGGKTKIKSRWKKDKMIIDIDFPSRPNPAGGTITPNLTMTYSLDKAGRLLLSSTVGIGGTTLPPLTVDRVYDRGTAESAPATPPTGEPQGVPQGAPQGVPQGQPSAPPPGS
jgi:hypothetical protein